MEPRDYTPEELARGRAVEQLRRLSHQLIRADASVEQLDSLAGQLGAAAAVLAPLGERSRSYERFEGYGELQPPEDGGEFWNSPDRAFSGFAHPWGIPLRVYRDGDRAVTTVVFDREHEGAPGRSHGGFVAAIFDDLLGFLLMLHGSIAFTAYLTVSYRAASEIGVPLRFSVGIDRVEGKKLFLSGECRNDEGELVSSCEALFIDAMQFFQDLEGADGDAERSSLTDGD